MFQAGNINHTLIPAAVIPLVYHSGDKRSGIFDKTLIRLVYLVITRRLSTLPVRLIRISYQYEMYLSEIEPV